MSRSDKAVIIICLGPNPTSPEKTMQSLKVCSGILDYFRGVHGKGYLMAINFSLTKLVQAKTPEMAEASLRNDCHDWAGALQRAHERLAQDSPRRYRHCEIVLVGTDEVPSRVEDASTLCERLNLDGVRVNSIMVEPKVSDEDGAAATSLGEWAIVTPTFEEEDGGWGMIRLARATGGLSLEPNSEGKLAVHQLFGEMFRRWGKDYWASANTTRQQ